MSNPQKVSGVINYNGEKIAHVIKGRGEKAVEMTEKAKLFEHEKLHKQRACYFLKEVINSKDVDPELKGRIKEFLTHVELND